MPLPGQPLTTTLFIRWNIPVGIAIWGQKLEMWGQGIHYVTTFQDGRTYHEIPNTPRGQYYRLEISALLHIYMPIAAFGNGVYGDGTRIFYGPSGGIDFHIP